MRSVLYFVMAYVRAPVIVHNSHQFMSYIRRSGLFLSAVLLSGGLSPVQAAPFPAQAWTYATVGLTTAQIPTATTRHRPEAAALTDEMQASSEPLITVLPELASGANPLSAQLSTPLGLLSASMRQWMAQALTPGQVARTLSSFGSTGAGGVAGNMAQSLIDQGWDRLEEELRGNFFRTINLNWRPGYGGREDILQIDTVMSLWDQGNSSIFGQAGLQSRDGEGGLHVGLGYRARPVEAVLLGLNIFYDYLSDPEVSRYSLGAEAQTVYGGVSANWYQGLSDERLSDGRTAYSPDGFDIEFSGRVPGLPYLELTGRYYRWNGQGAGTRDLEGTEYGLRLTPVPLFTVKGVYEDLSGGGDDVGVEALMEYRFGVPWQEQLRTSAVAQRSDPWQRRFERVRRQYEQRVQHRGTATPGSSPDTQTPDLRVLATASGVRLVFMAPSAVSSVRVAWARTAAAGTELGTAEAQRSALTPIPGVSGLYAWELTQTGTGFTFDPNTSYRFMVALRSSSGTVITTLTADGPGTGGSNLFVNASAGSSTLSLSWQRQTGARSARLSWRQVSTLGVSSASGTPAPLVENEDITLDLTDTTICPSSGTTCAYTISGLQTGTQYVVTLEIYSGANAAGTRLNNGSVTRTTSGNRATSVVSVVATPSTISEGGTASTITVSASPAPNVRGGLSVPYTLTPGTGLSPSEYRLTAGSTTLTGLTGNITLPAGESSVSLTLTAMTDAAVEGAETLTLRLSDPLSGAGYTLASARAAVVTITDESMPAVSFTADAVPVAEAAGSVTLTLRLSGPPISTVGIPVSTANGTATAGADYTAFDEMVTFAVGNLTQTVSVPILNDVNAEGAETFTVSLGTLPTGVAMGDTASATVTIIDDDAPTVSFTTGAVSAAEGDGTVDISVRLSDTPPPGGLTIPVATANGTATAGTDYTTLSTNVTFAAGATGAALTQTLSVPILNDTASENDETFTVSFGPLPTGVSAGTTSRVTVTITDDDAPAVSFTADAVLVEENALSGMVELTLQLNRSPASTVTIPVSTANGTATAGSDYTALSGATVTFASGATGAGLMQTVSVAILNDSRQEDEETFTVSLGALPPGVVAGTRSSVTVSITDDDMPTVSFATGTTEVAETDGTLTVTVQLDVTPQNQIVVPVMTANGTATAGSDYTALSGAGAMVTFTAGATDAALRQTVTVAITDDAALEGNETFTLSFGTLPTGVTAAVPDSVTVTIVDDDVPTVSFTGADAVSVAEGDGTVTLTVALSAALPTDTVTVPVMTTAGTATAGSDYTTLSMNLTFAAGATGAALQQTVSVTILDDSVDENDETFTVSLGTLPSTVSGSGTVTVTITDDDTPTVSFTGAATRTVAEAAGTVALTVTLDSTPVTDIRLPVMTTNGTATAGQDYSSVSRDLIFTAGATGAALTQTVNVAITDDSVVEPDETFTVSLGTLPDGVTAGSPTSVTVTIDSEDTTMVSFQDVRATILEGGGVSVSVTLTNPVQSEIEILLVFVDGSAMDGVHYTAVTSVIVPAGTLSGSSRVQTIDDDADNPNRVFTVRLSTSLPPDVIAIPRELRILIRDNDDPLPALSVAADPTTIAEGQTSTITITASSAPATNLPVSFAISGANITTDDYTLTSGGSALTGTEVTLAASTNSVTITLTAADDADTSAEMLTVTLTAGTGYTVGGTSTATITIDPLPPPLTVSFASGTAQVGEAAGTLAVTVQLNVSPSGETIIPIMTGGGTATAGTDYTALSGAAAMVTFASGATGADLMQTVSVTITDDAVAEGNETFTLSFGPGALPSGVTAGTPATVTVTVVDDDVPVVSFMGADAVSVGEGDGTVSLTVALSAALATPLTVPVMTANDTATAGTDYTALSGASAMVVFAANATGAGLMQTVSVAILNDTADENDETFTVSLGVLPSTVSGSGTVTVTITDDDVPALSVAASPTTITEGAASTLTITADIAPANDLTIPYTITGVTAADYTLTTGSTTLTGLTGSVTLAAAQTSVALTLTAVDDADSAETLTYTLNTPVSGAGYTLTTAAATIMIDPAAAGTLPTVQFSATTATVAENVSGGMAVLTLELSEAATEAFQVTVNTAGRTAMFRDDYMSALNSGNVTFAVGETMQTVSIPIVDDALVEPDETFRASIANLNAMSSALATLGARDAVTVTIDSEDTGSVEFSSADLTVDEDAGFVSVEILLAGGTLVGPATVIPLVMTDDSALAGTHYTTVTSGTISAGGNSVSVDIPITDDAVDNTDRTFTVSLGTPLPMDITPGTITETTISITDDDDPLTVQFSSATAMVAEDAGMATVTLELSEAATEQIIVPIMTTNGTATAGAGNDYTALAADATVTFAINDTEQTISVTILDDVAAEGNETFTLSFSPGALPSGVTAGTPNSVTVTIVDDDVPVVSFMGADAVSVTEAAGTVELTVALSAALATPLTVPVMTANGTATAGSDYTALSGASAMVVFAANATGAGLMQTVSVTILNDTADENDETFTVSLGVLPSTVSGSGTVTVTITDDDVPALSVAADPTTITEGAASTITITADIAPANDLTIPFTIDGTGIAAADYTLTTGSTTLTGLTGNVTLPATQTSVELTLTAVNDADSAETLTYTLNTPVSGAGYTLTTAAATIMIDPAPLPTVQFSAATATVAEDAGMATVTLELSSAATERITFFVGTTGNTATFQEDYMSGPMVVFNVNDTMATASVPILNDALVEPDETFTISLDPGRLPASVIRGVRNTVTVTIDSEDIGSVEFASADLTVGEGDGNVSVDISLSGGVMVGPETVIPLVITDGTALAGTHYTAVTTGIIKAGGNSVNVDILILGDGVDNANRMFTVSLGTPLPTDITSGTITETTIDHY